LDVQPVDPRDATSEIEEPTYRVYFWTRVPLPSGIPADVSSYRSDEFQLTGAGDVHEAIAWAEHNANGRRYTLYAVVSAAREKTLVRLAGVDPTRGG
jgi:hypothetical protein